MESEMEMVDRKALSKIDKTKQVKHMDQSKGPNENRITERPLPQRIPKITGNLSFTNKMTILSGTESRSATNRSRRRAFPVEVSDKRKASSSKNKSDGVYPRLNEPEDSGNDSGRDIQLINEKISRLIERRKELKIARGSHQPITDTVNRKNSRKPSRTEVSEYSDTDSNLLRQKEGSRRSNLLSPNLDTPSGPPGGRSGRVARRRAPKTAAVTITSLNTEVSYADILKTARDKISLDNMGIEDSRIRKSLNGGVIIEIPGADGASKADLLAKKLKEVLSASAKISRPTVMGELRLWNFDDSVSPTEIKNMIPVRGDCDEQDIKLSTIRRMNNGLHSIWAKCPLTAALRLTLSNKIKIGWTVARVELLEARPVQCFKCWRFGHVRNTCEFPEDRTGSCFRNREAQDLLLHHSEELGAAVCVVSEPARRPGSQQWFRSLNGLAAVYVNTRIAKYPAIFLAQSQNAVMIQYGRIKIVSCYITPNIDYNGYANFMDELSVLISSITNNNNLLVCGDFNAHALHWGSRRQNFKGDLLEDWVHQADLRLMDVEMYQMAIDWICAVTPGDETYMIDSIPDKWIHHSIIDACKVAVPRLNTRKSGPRIYWWSDEIARLRATIIAARRSWTRGRRRDPPDILSEKRAALALAKSELKLEIRKAKSRAWQELISTLDDDPWGLPYKVVLNRLRKSTPGLFITLEPDILTQLLDNLFPPGNALRPVDLGDCEEGRTPVILEEVVKAIDSKKNLETAPGPDGLKAIALKRLPISMNGRIAVFQYFVKIRYIPRFLEDIGSSTHSKGEAPPVGEVPKARPICLLNEIGKTFERVIANRLTQFMDENPASNLSDNQFGFRRLRSTTDALFLVKKIVTEARANGKVALAFSLDIENAFNSVKLPGIRTPLRTKNFPLYLRRIVEAFLSGRRIIFFMRNGKRCFRWVNRGVSQGSVLGPLLWNLAFDLVLRTLIFDGCHIICYADDTLLIIVEDDLDAACALLWECLTRILINISALGLKISWAKSEAMLFGRAPANSFFEFEGHRIRIAKTEKVTRVSRALCGILPNLRGPIECKRRLYYSVVMSIVLYAAPIWSDELAGSGSKQRILRRAIRLAALRTVMAYRTVSYEAATLLSTIPPVYLYAAYLRRVYLRLCELKELGTYTSRSPAEERAVEWLELRRQWAVHIDDERLSGKSLAEDTADHTLSECNYWGLERGELTAVVGQDLSLTAVIGQMCNSREAWCAFSTFAERVLRCKEENERRRQQGIADPANIVGIVAGNDDFPP
ncbi:uncharacterized protein [Temnothorax nylanderi]|uniref:uncharacterized protein n=1 Tax=Temnothorax nylanderi TaxID=102681 RepID=UPI003A856D19